MGLVLGGVTGLRNCVCAKENAANGHCSANSGACASISRWDNDSSRRI